MSVINNVLKNLESRESRFTPIEMDSVVTGTATTRDLKPWLLGSLLILALMFGAWMALRNTLPTGIFQSSPKVATPGTQEVVEPITTPVAEPEAKVATVVEAETGNQIIGLQIRESEDVMRMEFALREKVVVYLRERGENYFGYHLRDVESQIAAPQISDNEWISELSIVASAAGIDIDFETPADILVETRQELRDGEPYWSISLRKSVIPEQNATLIKADSVKGSSGDKMAASEPQPNPVIDKPAPKQVEPVAQAQTSTDEMSAAPVEIDIKSTNPSTTSINQLEYAVELINSRRSADAEVLLRGLLGGIEDYSARKHLLALYSQQKLAGRERQLLLESMVRYPDDELFRTEYGRALFSAGSYREVIEFFVDGKAVNANQQALAAASHQRLDEHEEAVQYYGLALAQDATNARNWIGLGISQENTAAPRAALESYQRAARLGNLSGRLQTFVNKRSNALRQVLN